jgi:signal transduction histidine kinase
MHRKFRSLVGGNPRDRKSIGRIHVSRVLQALVAPVKESKGKTIGAVAIDSNLAELTRLEAKIHQNAAKQKLLLQRAELLKHQNTELRELNKSKDEFIALASHQLRTPATGVKQYVGMLLEGYAGELTSNQREFLERAYESNERQLSTINDLLQIARIDANKLELIKHPTDLVALVQSAEREQRSTFKRRDQTVDLQAKPPALEVNVDKPRLRMAIDNLLDNAGKYSPAGTVITIAIHKTKTAAYVDVTDHGVGIAKQDFSKLFQKFSRIDNPLSISVGGNGLGLYVAKKVIDAHGGNISIDSTLGKGTTFTVMLPLLKK